jgi:hypothetical protein
VKTQSTHRVAIADFWRTSHHDGKISPGWCRCRKGCRKGCTPTPFKPITITYKVAVNAPAERADTLPLQYFISTLFVTCGRHHLKLCETHLDEIGERLSGQNPILDALLLLAHAHQAGQHPVQDDPLVVCQRAAPAPGNSQPIRRENKYRTISGAVLRSGSRSVGSIYFWASWFRIRILLLSSKNTKEKPCFLLFCDFFLTF